METKIYIPEAPVKRGLKIYFDMIKELTGAKELVIRLFIL